MPKDNDSPSERRKLREKEDRDNPASPHLDELLMRIEVELERVNGLYQQFRSGHEALPPVESRKALEILVNELKKMERPTAAALFRARTVLNRFSSHSSRWDKLMKDVESGALVRPLLRGRKREK